MPQIIRPIRIIEWLWASAMEDQPAIKGATDSSKAFLRPYASIMGTEASDPIGVAAEWMEAVKGERNWINCRNQCSTFLPPFSLGTLNCQAKRSPNWILMSERFFLPFFLASYFVSNFEGVRKKIKLEIEDEN